MAILDDFVFELCIGDKWQDITPDVYADPEIVIERGRTSGTGQASPSKCTFAIDNANGKYSPRNPMGPYYSVLGRNQPIRVARKVASDSFDGRTVTSGWGAADLGGAWSFFSSGGTDYVVNSGVGKHIIAGTSAFRLSYLAGQLFGDVDVSATVSLPFSNVTGGNVEPCNLVIGGLSTSDYFLVAVKISSAEAITISINHVSGTIVSAIVTKALVYTGQPLAVRFQQEGQNLRAKVWAAAAMEPYAWDVEARSNLLVNRAKGWVGIRSGVGAGNTNTPVTFSYDSFQVRSNRFAGEVPEWPATWDPNGGQSFIQVEAAGVRRRIGQGEPQLKSPYLRGNQTISPPHLAYWPVEDGRSATQIASGIGGSPMLLVAGNTTFETNSDFPGSGQIAVPNACRWVGTVPRNSATGQIQMVYLLSIPASGEVDQATLSQIQTTGSAAFIDCFYQAGGGLKLAFYGPDRVAFHTSGNIALALNGRPVQLSIELTQNGANVDYTVAILEPFQDIGIAASATAPSCTIGAVKGVFVNAYRQAKSSAIGHVAIRNSITSIYTLADQLRAYWGEASNARVARLGTENGIPTQYLWDGAIAGVPMGIQRQNGLLSLIDECADADQGSVHESRCGLGLVQRARSSMYNQVPTLVLDFNADRVIPPLLPAEDDQEIRNDVTVTRQDGSSYQIVQTTGALAVTDPSNSRGVGRYATGVTLNLAYDSQTVDAAGWMLNLGTTDKPRYPGLQIGLAPLPLSASPQKMLDALAVNLDDRITVANGPFVDPGTVSQLVRGYTERFDGIEHVLEFNCTPDAPYQVAVLGSTALGRSDTETSVLAGAMTPTATAMYVYDSTCTWTTDPAEMPIPVTVGGEDMSVTAITSEALTNPTFEPGLSPWTASGTSSFTLSSTQKHSGSFAGRLVPDGVSANVGPASELIPVVGGMQVSVSVWVWVTTATSNFACAVNWFDAAGVYITTSSSFPAVPAATWTQVKNVYTAPANAASAQLVPVLVGTPSAAQVWYVDDASFQGPQRFTVVRSANGVVKSQTSGAQVSLTRRAVLAL
ncbi:carbohydrate binding domain-containing protein [Amycolatopsis kentuckyensis]|uniref:carbohydrate binding domain-containing protein n=1 Tax=Amycolatopsis kentuckyensis TaxID=218823 RepID=UPI00356AE13E